MKTRLEGKISNPQKGAKMNNQTKIESGWEEIDIKNRNTAMIRLGDKERKKSYLLSDKL